MVSRSRSLCSFSGGGKFGIFAGLEREALFPEQKTPSLRLGALGLIGWYSALVGSKLPAEMTEYATTRSEYHEIGARDGGRK
ncbi:unnamed protein product [Linum trigynum]|uniref:Uncharacterized protein n=1 Tax=Linum trigynum TaxID=586398 RepID=A0AAV2G8S8_9ROSI